MRNRSITKAVALPASYATKASQVYSEGIMAGFVGAATVAAWFLILDTLQGRPLYTPTVLGTALFLGIDRLPAPQNIAISWEMTLMYTWVHLLVFAVIGGVVSKLLAVAKGNPSLGFGVLLLFVVLEFGFIAASFLFAETVLHALAWPAVLVGNLLAAASMSIYFWRRHPHIAIRP